MNILSLISCIFICVPGWDGSKPRDQPGEVHPSRSGAVPGGTDLRRRADPWITIHPHSLPCVRPLQGRPSFTDLLCSHMNLLGWPHPDPSGALLRPRLGAWQSRRDGGVCRGLHQRRSGRADDRNHLRRRHRGGGSHSGQRRRDVHNHLHPSVPRLLHAHHPLRWPGCAQLPCSAQCGAGSRHQRSPRVWTGGGRER